MVAKVVKGYLRTVGIKLANRWGTPLYKYDSMQDSYLVEDYPYGFKLRTSIRYWLEYAPKKGWRFVSQTMNPKRPGTWNKPKASTYALLGANMYLDGKGHVQWAAVTQYTDEKEILEFVKAFPKSDFRILKIFAPKKIQYLEKSISGELVWTINNVPKPNSEADTDRHKAELEVWQDIEKAI